MNLSKQPDKILEENPHRISSAVLFIHREYIKLGLFFLMKTGDKYDKHIFAPLTKRFFFFSQSC